MAPTYKLLYFNVRSKAEFIRYLLAQSALEFGQLPVLEIEGKTEKLGQSLVIGAYLGAELGFAGADNFEAARIAQFATGVAELQEAFYKHDIPYHIYPWMNKVDPEKVKALFKVHMTEIFDTFCERYSKQIESNGGTWLVGKKISWADLYLAELNERILKNCGEDLLDKYPLLKEHEKRVHELPAIKDLVAKRNHCANW